MRRVLAGAALAAIGLLPLAFGGTVPAAWALYGAVAGLLLLVWGVQQIRRPLDPMSNAERSGLGLLVAGHLILAVWMALQAWPVPGWQHPVWDLAAEYFADGTGEAGEASAVGTISVAPADTVQALTRWLAFGATFLLICGLARRRETAWMMVRGLALIGLLYAVYGLIVEFGGFGSILWYEKWAYRDVLTSTFVNRNSYATFGGLAALCWLAWLLKAAPAIPDTLPRRERLLRQAQALGGPLILIWAGLAIVVTSVLLTQSRAGVAAMMLGLLTGHIVSRGLSGRRLLLSLAPILLVGGVAAFSAEGVLARIDRQGLQEHTREAAARLMVRATADAPLTGFGWGAFEPAFNLYRDTTLTVRFDRGHNDVLETIFQVGLPAALLLFAMLGLLMAFHARGLWLRRRDRELPALGLAAGGLVVFHAFFDFSLQMPAVAVFYLAIAAIGWSQSHSSRGA